MRCERVKRARLLLVSILLSLPGDGDHEDPISLEDV